ncbi:hypothetical protein FNO09_13230 [Salmonella enterica subsp. diarizonae]|nr:hypothetical protein [Salmonella enterica subsp. diarizonae]EDR0252300.1 hypothetical protein [Salmonella enterica subsp. diarizonae]EDX3146868.1 hypothetical protein [Salmonella enterica subsp. diarizonae serovar 61:l,v:1,5,7]EJY9250263.1 hypothetical protein [Salmonella enterica]EKG3678861.1 hypothetical protein [Salmonella enterica]
MMIHLKRFVILVVIIFPAFTRAFQVDTLSRIMTTDHDYLLLTGDSGREYLYTDLSRVQVDSEGNIHETPLTPEHIQDWPVIVDPGEIVLDQGDEVRVRINRNGPQRQDDIVLGLSFIPESAAVKEKRGSGLQIAVGYKVWLFIPGTAPLRGNVTASRQGGKIVVNNTSNKILRVAVSHCSGPGAGKCDDNSIISLPGTRKAFDATEGKYVLNVYGTDRMQKKIKVITL